MRTPPYTPPLDTPEQEMKTLISALRTYYIGLTDEHNALVSIQCSAPMECNRSRIEHLRIERARCTRIIEHVNHKYLDMIEKRAKG